MFSKLASRLRDVYETRKATGKGILVGEEAIRIEKAIGIQKVRVAESISRLAEANERLAELIKIQIRHGEEGTCSCGKCKHVIPERKKKLESLGREVNRLRVQRESGAWSTVVLDTKDPRLNSALTELVKDMEKVQAQLGETLKGCRARLAHAGFPIVMFPRLWLLLESCIAAKSEQILVDGLEFLLGKYMQRTGSTPRWRCDIEYAFKAISLVLSCAWDDAKETVHRVASRCWWLLLFAERVGKLLTKVVDFFHGDINSK